ncbi:MAG TPA: thioredoxin domain-containing protein [Saprospiraceae bacterium]|nr:thioredoxin domain-containing protein [Saprospiraceae bacterium]HPI08178.1 thioredoxin domain-containing protein [Saprospiraceae bacterium]
MNHLQHERSPYLLQHAHNPVHWHAWKPEAFERARAEQKPILVSIGYSTCHWCHVMERESFENEEIAAFMNEHFINIKVDREERPDVDAIYMEACQILTGGGGWPLNCFLTPEGKPFYAGTYFPPRPAHNRPSWIQLLQHLSNIWQTEPQKAIDQADNLTRHIEHNDGVFLKKTEEPAVSGVAGFQQSDLDAVFTRLQQDFDPLEGGFGGAPKFPATMALQFLLSYHYFSRRPEALGHALLSLDKMIQGGIYDQLGGGFSRYATDRGWLVPHFEKMLYDNALLVSVLSEAYKYVLENNQFPDAARRAQLYRETIEETLQFIGREMTHTEGGFYSALDADSEGVEGKFYVWEQQEVEAVLGSDAGLFCAFYGVTHEGNWEEKNILWRPASFEAFAQFNGMEVHDLKKRLAAGRELLLAARALRIRPGLDDKILLGWNALMCSAYTAAYKAMAEESFRITAVRNMDFLLEKFASANGDSLLHTWKDGEAQYDAFLEDYAFLIAALVDIYEITFDVNYLRSAEKYTRLVLSYFLDPVTGLFYFTGSGQTDIVLRKKDLQDNATPSGNSTMAHNLQRLSVLLGRPDWREMAQQMLRQVEDAVKKYPRSFERWALAMMMEAHPYHEIGVLGANAFETAAAIQRWFLPNGVIAASSQITDELPLLAEKVAGKTDALIYVCRDFTCQRPVTGLDDFRQLVRPAAHTDNR